MMDILFIVIGLLVTFLIVVIIHELGHLVAACCLGVKPEIFSVGFGKSLWSRTDKRGIRWQVGAFPIGGYVRFVGDENAASLSTVSDGPALPGSLRAASKLRQAIVVLAGPVANFILTVVLLSAVPIVSGVTAYPWTIETVNIWQSENELRTGDVIHKVGNTAINPATTPQDILAALEGDDEVTYLITRAAKEISIVGPRPDLPLLGYVAPGSPAEVAGLKVGDLLLTASDRTLTRWSDLQDVTSKSDGEAINVIGANKDGLLQTEVYPIQNDGKWLIGVSSAPLYTLHQETPSPIAALGTGLDQSWELLKRTTVGLASSLIGRGDPCALDGPLAIGKVAGQAIQLGPVVFLTFMAVISLGLSILNLLPIPILDGGHLLMLGIEGATGRPMGKRLQALLFIAGVTLIVFLMLTATINDLRC